MYHPFDLCLSLMHQMWPQIIDKIIPWSPCQGTATLPVIVY